MLVLLWCGISILKQSSENGSKMWKILKNSIFTMIVDVSMATEYIKTIFGDEFCNYGILPLSCEYKPNKTGNCIFSENLRPKMPLINPGPL